MKGKMSRTLGGRSKAAVAVILCLLLVAAGLTFFLTDTKDSSAAVDYGYQGYTPKADDEIGGDWIRVRNAADFKLIGTDAESMSKKYVLMSSIDLSAHNTAADGYFALGLVNGSEQKIPFSGILDGNGYEINFGTKTFWRHSQADRTFFALFAELSGTIKNLQVKGTITVQDSLPYSVGSIAGSINGGTVENCYVDADVTVSNDSKPSGVGINDRRQYVGLVAGSLDKGLINTTTAIGRIKNDIAAAQDIMQELHVGGIVGYIGGATGMVDKGTVVSNCLVTAVTPSSTDSSKYLIILGDESSGANAKSNSGDRYAGGIAGSSIGKIINCHTDGYTLVRTFSAKTINVGGIAGLSSGTIQSSESQGTVYATNATNDSTINAGGIAGVVTGGRVTDNEGRASTQLRLGWTNATFYAGGLIGYVSGESVTLTNNTAYGKTDVTKTSSQIINTAYVGGAIGYSKSAVTDNHFRGELNVSLSAIDSVTTGKSLYVGGLVGKAEKKISGCTTLDTTADTVDEQGNVVTKRPAKITVETKCLRLYAGGLVGETSADITGCSTAVDMDISGATYAMYSGGLAGSVTESAKVEGCTVIGRITFGFTTTSGVDTFCGGLIGIHTGGVLLNNAVSGDITFDIKGYNSHVLNAGGIVGRHESSSRIEGCVYEGEKIDITTKSVLYCGGIAGWLKGKTSVIGCRTGGQERSTEIKVTGVDFLYVGGITGYVSDTAKIYDSFVCAGIDVTLSQANNTGEHNKTSSVGGVVGRAGFGGEIIGCGSEGSVSLSTSKKQNHAIGGILGWGNDNGANEVEGAKIENCYSKMNVTGMFFSNGGSNHVKVGGIGGHVRYDIINCYSTGNITGSYAGGIVGSMARDANNSIVREITGCFSTGNVVGNAGGDIRTSAGIVAYAPKIAITDCYASGNIGAAEDFRVGGIIAYVSEPGTAINTTYFKGKLLLAENNRGGIVGSNGASNTVTGNNNYVINTSYIDDSTNQRNFGTSLTVTGYDKSQFPGFDFDEVWTISANSAEYFWPVLRAIDDPATANSSNSYQGTEPSGGVRVWRALVSEVFYPDESDYMDDNGYFYRIDRTAKTAVFIGIKQDYCTQWMTGVQQEVTVELRGYISVGGTEYKLVGIADDVLSGMTALKKLIIPNEAEYIGESAFESCPRLTTVIIGNGVTDIAAKAFSGCAALAELTLGTGIKRIGAQAFYSCSELPFVNLGGNLQSIGDEAFARCLKLYSAGFWCDRPEDMGKNVFFLVNQSFTINYSSMKNGWNNIRAWNNDKGWKINYVETDDEYEVRLSGQLAVLNHIEGDKYRDEFGITYTLAGEQVYVGTTGAAVNNSGYKGANNGIVTLPATVLIGSTGAGPYPVVGIYENAFGGNKLLKEITVPEHVTSIGDNALSCPNLQRVYASFEWFAVNANVFEDVSDKLQVIYNMNKDSWVAATDFGGKDIYGMAILNADATDDQGILYTLNRSTGTATVGSLSGGDNRINTSGYSGENNGVVKLGEYVSHGGDIYMLTAIDRYAFYNNPYLKEILIGGNISGANAIGDAAFRQTPALEKFEVDDKNTGYAAKDGLLFAVTVITVENKSDIQAVYDNRTFALGEVVFTRLVSVPAMVGLTEIALTSVNGLETVVIIENYAAAGNKTVRTLTAQYLEIIGDSAFDSSLITTLDISAYLTEIGANAFFNSGLSGTVTLYETLKKMGVNAFASCGGITEFVVTAPAEPPMGYMSPGDEEIMFRAQGGALYGRSESSNDFILLRYPAGSKTADFTVPAYIHSYTRTNADEDGGGEYTVYNYVTGIAERAFDSAVYLKNIVIGDSVRAIGYMAFAGCNNLRTVGIGKGLSSIGDYAFFDCFSLNAITVAEENNYFIADENGVLFNSDKTVLILYPAGQQRVSYTVPDSVTRIESFAFANARALLRVILPAGVNYVGDSAFAECTRLKYAYFKGDAPTNYADGYFGKSVFELVSDDFVINYREKSLGWGNGTYGGYRISPYNAISELESDTVAADVYIFIIVDSYGQPHDSFMVSFDNSPYKQTDERGVATFAVPVLTAGNRNDSYLLKVTDADKKFYEYSNSEFTLDRNLMLTYITMIDLPTVSGVSVKGSGTVAARDINSEILKVNVSPDNVEKKKNNAWRYEEISITVDGFCASIHTIEEYALIQDGMILARDTNFGDGFLPGKYTFESIPYYKFMMDTPIFAMIRVSNNDIFYTELKIDIFRMDHPDTAKILGNSVIKVANDVPLVGGMGFNFGGNWSVNLIWEPTDDTFKVGIGFEYSVDDSEDDARSALQKATDELKKGQKGGSTSLSLSLLGYMEFRYDRSGVKLDNFGITGGLSITVEYGNTYLLGYVPIRMEIELGFSADAELNFIMVYDHDVTSVKMGDSEITLGVSVTVRAGVGCSVASVGIYGKAGLVFVFELPKFTPQKITLSGEMGIYLKLDFKIFKLKFEYKLFGGEWVIYTRDKGGNTRSMALPDSVQPMSLMFSPNNYRLMSVDEAVANDAVASSGYTYIKAGDNTFRINSDVVYDNGYTTVAAYDEYNYSKLVWSMYNEANGTWLDSRIICDNGFVDGEFSYYVHEGNIYLAYTQLDKKLGADLADADNNDALSEYAKAMEVRVARLNLSDIAAGWQDLGSVTREAVGSGSYDMMPSITVAADGTPVVTWIRNTENNFFGMSEAADSTSENPVYQESTANSVWYSRYQGGVWSAPACLADGLMTVTSVALTPDGVTIIADMDSDVSTADDRMIYGFALTDSVSVEEFSDLDSYKKIDITGAYLGIVYKGGRLIYITQDNLYYLDGDTAFFADPLELGGEYLLLENNGTITALVYEVTILYADEEAGSALWGIFFDAADGKWGQPVQLHEFGAGNVLDSFGAMINASGNLVFDCIVYKSADDITVVKSVEYLGDRDISLTGVSVDYAEVAAGMSVGGGFVIEVDVKNVGSGTVSRLNYSVTAPDGTVVASDFEDNKIYSGNSDKLYITVSVGALAKGDYTVKVWADDEDESLMVGNTVNLALAYTDLSVHSKHVVLGGANYILVYVKNYGYLASGGTLHVVRGVFDASSQALTPDILCYSYDVAELKYLSGAYFLVELDDPEFYESANSGGVVTLYLETAEADSSPLNNHSRIAVNELSAAAPASEPKQARPGIFAAVNSYDKVIGGAFEVLVDLNNENTLSGLELNGVALASDTDYAVTVDGANDQLNTVSLNASYMSELAAGTYTLTFIFDQGGNVLTQEIDFAVGEESYTVTWIMESITQYDTVLKGEEPEFSGNIHKEPTPEYDYEFIGWAVYNVDDGVTEGEPTADNLNAVTEDVTYIAVFREVARKYNIYFDFSGGQFGGNGTADFDMNYGYALSGSSEIGNLLPVLEDAEFVYTFEGWTDVYGGGVTDIVTLPETVTDHKYYFAVYSSVRRGYKVNYNVSGLEGFDTSVSAVNGDTYTVADALVEDGYTFSGWKTSDVIVGLDGDFKMPASDVTFVGVFTKNVYNYTFVDYDGTVLASGTAEHGTTPVYGGNAPTRAADAEYTYTFTGWDKVLSGLTGPTEYTAQYSKTKVAYEITYRLNGEQYGDKVTLAWGEVIQLLSAPAVETGYAFSGWTTDCVVMPTQNITVTGTTTLNTYAYTFVDYDGTVFASGTAEHGTTPVYGGNAPVRAADAEYIYTFTGWDKVLSGLTGSAEYTAQYSKTKVAYEITYMLNGEQYGDKVTLAWGEVIQLLSAPAVETGYTFGGWTTDCVVMPTQNIEVTGTTTLNTYAYTFVDYDGTVLTSGNVGYNGTVTPPANPVRAVDNSYSYAFVGWNKDVSAAVTGNTEFVAVYTTTPRYEYRFMDGEMVLKSARADSGTVITAPILPVKEGYYSSWDKSFDRLTGDTTINAVYTRISIVAVDVSSDILSGYALGDKLPTPTAPSGKAFGGWYTDEALTDQVVSISGADGDITLYAKWITLSTTTTRTGCKSSVTSATSVISVLILATAIALVRRRLTKGK